MSDLMFFAQLAIPQGRLTAFLDLLGGSAEFTAGECSHRIETLHEIDALSSRYSDKLWILHDSNARGSLPIVPATISAGMNFDEMNQCLQMLESRFSWSVFNWGNGGAGNPVGGFIASNPSIANSFAKVMVGGRYFNGPEQSLIASRYTLDRSFQDLCNVVLFDEEEPGKVLFASGVVDEIYPLSVMPGTEINGDHCEMLASVDGPFQGMEPLMIERRTSIEGFVESAIEARNKNLGMIAFPGDLPLDVIKEAIALYYNDPPVFDVQMRASARWIFSVGRSQGDHSMSMFSSTDRRLMNVVGEASKVRIVSAW